MTGWGVRMLMAGFCLGVALERFMNGDDITFLAIAAVCWFLSALLSYDAQNWGFR